MEWLPKPDTARWASKRGHNERAYTDHLHAGWDIPLNAVTVTLACSIIVSMIILGSPVAFFTLGSLCNSALYASYFICIGCMARRRILNEPMLPASFDLGRKFGLFCNVTAMSFEAVQFVFVFFPVAPNPTVPLFNWTLLVFGVVVLWAIAYYHVWGKKNYQGPVAYVRRLDM